MKRRKRWTPTSTGLFRPPVILGRDIGVAQPHFCAYVELADFGRFWLRYSCMLRFHAGTLRQHSGCVLRDLYRTRAQ